MKEVFVVGLVGLSVYLLYRNHQLKKMIAATATPAATPASAAQTVAAPASASLNLVQQVQTPTAVEIVPDSMLQHYDAEVLRKFPWS